MIVQLKVDVGDRVRKALRIRMGEKGVATRKEIRAELERLIYAHFEEVCYDADREERGFDTTE